LQLFSKVTAASLTLFCLLAPSYATPISSDPGGGGVGGNAASAPGPSSSYPWVGTVDDTNTGTGNKTTEIPTISWNARGGLKVDLTLYHNSETNFPSPFGYKWLLIYQSQVGVDSSGNVGVTWGDGRKYKFGNTSGVYSPPPGIHEKLIVTGSNPVASYDIIEKDQTKYHFANYGGVYVLNTITDENGNQITVNNSSNGGLISVTDPSNRTVTFGYNGPSAGFYNTMTDPLGHVVNLSYDASGNLSQVTYPTINGSSYSTVLGYDPNHNVTSIKDMRGNTSTFSYNSADNSLALEKDNLGNQTSFSYGSTATTITDPNGHSTVHTYTNGRLSQVTDALGYSEAYSYDTANNVTQKQDRRSYYWNSTFDAMGNVLTAADPYGNTTTYTYNAHNKVLTVTLPLGRSAAGTYDTADNLTQVQQKDAAGNIAATTKFTIGSYGLVSDKYNPYNHHTGYTYDANGYLASTTTPLGHKTLWAYDALGFQTSRTDAMGRTTTYTPDAWERLTTLTYPDSTTRTYGYDPNGNLTSFNNAIVSISRSYDADNRLLADYYGGVRAVSHAYDASGQKGLLSTTTDYLGNVHAFTYTARNQLSQASIPGQTVSYVYDPNGNQSQAYLPNGLRTDTFYLANNWRSSVYNISNTTGAVLSAYDCSFNADGQIAYTLEGHSTNPSTNNETTENFGYDGLGHLTSEVRNGTVPENISYAYDAAGNRTSQSGSALNGTFSYDADDELTGFTYSGTSYASATFGYDANGERNTETTGLSASGGGYGTQYGYDFEGNLTGITAAGSGSVAFKYDGLDRQLGWQASNGTRLDYQMDGSVPLTKTSPTSSKVNLYGNGLVSSGGETLLSDGLGAVRQTTNSSQSVQWSGTSQAFGVPLAASGGTANHYQWGAASGYRTDGFGPTYASPLLKVGARYYDPEFGCFLSRDTDLSQSPYVYCDGDPVNCHDPSGHLSIVNIASGGICVSEDQCKGAADAPVDVSEDQKKLGEAITKLGDDLAIFGGGVSAYGPKLNTMDPESPLVDVSSEAIFGFGVLVTTVGGAIHYFGEAIGSAGGSGGSYAGSGAGPFNVDPSPHPGRSADWN